MKDRIALVIGNSDYIYVNKLNNPKNDANDIASVLNRLNFDVTKVTDVNLTDLQKAINTFLKDLDDYGRDHILLRYVSPGLYQADFSGKRFSTTRS